MPHISEIQMRDPFVLVEGGFCYLYGSTDKDIWKAPGVGFDVYRSSGSLEVFDGPFPAFRPPADFWATKNFWAPEAYHYNGSYYIFATFKRDGLCRGTAVLKGDSPLGPFAPWSDGPVTQGGWECLDGTLHIGGDGRPWMVFCHEWVQVGDGQICAVPLTPDLRRPDGEPELLFTASSAPWSLPMKNRAPGSYVTDGPNMYRAKNGSLLMLWSSMGENGYCIGVATSGSGLLSGPWRQDEKPLYSDDGGHGMLFTAPDGVLRLAIHRPNNTPHERPIFIPVRENEGVLTVTEDPAG